MQDLLSPIDRKILRLLQHNADLSAAEIAEKVELSQSPCWRRIHRMQEDGIIERKVALLSHKQLGFSITVFVDIKLSAHGRSNLEEFERAVVGYPEVLECFTMAGGWPPKISLASGPPAPPYPVCTRPPQCQRAEQQ